MMYPRMAWIKQHYEDYANPDIYDAVRRELEQKGLLDSICRGDRVLITAGSRGIRGFIHVLRACIEAVRERGGDPLIFPAMGSHGSGEASLQVAVLEHLGITEKTLGAPIYADLEMVEIGKTQGNVPVYTDRAVVEADHVILVNRIKEHTEYIGRTESGILKMAVVGLGRQLGAATMHRLAVNVSYEKAIHEIARVLFQQLPILGALAILEDHKNRFRRVEAMAAGEAFDREPALLEESKAYKPKLPFESLDILLVDQIGKDISGAGFDTKVIGRIMNIYEKECETPRITRIVLRDLSAKTDGNATGIGLADYITERAFKKIDYRATNINCITAAAPEKGRIPIALPTDRDALDAALSSIGLWRPETVKMAWISNTASLERLAVSEGLLEENPSLKPLEAGKGGLLSLPFDGKGHLPDLVQWMERTDMET